MESIIELIEQGKALGYKEQELKDFVKQQQDILREERAAKRQLEKEQLELRNEAEKRKQEKEQLELQAQLDRERWDAEMKKSQLDHEHQLEILTKKAELKSADKPDDSAIVKPKMPKLPSFDDSKDDMDSYLRRFERYADVMKWKKDMWATNLSALLKGRALDVYALLPPDQALDYDALKTALLKRFDLTEDGFKRKFRASRPEGAETFAQFSVRLSSYLHRWVDMSKTSKTFDGLFDLVMRDQFLNVCSKDLSLFLRERTPSSMADMADLADQFREARLTTACNLTEKTQTHSSQSGGDVSKTKTFENTNSNVPKSPDKKSFVPKSERRCYKCDKIGHIASECRPRSQGKVHAVVSNNDGNTNDDERPTSDNAQFCSAIFSQSDCLKASKAVLPDSNSTLVSSCITSNSSNLPVCTGFLDGNKVNVLRDTGCSGIVVRQSKIDQSNLTGSFETCILADGSSIQVPVAVISIDTPYLSGTFKALCMKSPVYDVILGNVHHVRDPGSPDPEWKPSPVSRVNQKVCDSVRNTNTKDSSRDTKSDDSCMNDPVNLVSTNVERRFNIHDSLRWFMTLIVLVMTVFALLFTSHCLETKARSMRYASVQVHVLNTPVENLLSVCTIQDSFILHSSNLTELKPCACVSHTKHHIPNGDRNIAILLVPLIDRVDSNTAVRTPQCRLQILVTTFNKDTSIGHTVEKYCLYPYEFQTFPIQTSLQPAMIQGFQNCIYGSEFCVDTVAHSSIRKYVDNIVEYVGGTLTVSLHIHQ